MMDNRVIDNGERREGKDLKGFWALTREFVTEVGKGRQRFRRFDRCSSSQSTQSARRFLIHTWQQQDRMAFFSCDTRGNGRMEGWNLRDEGKCNLKDERKGTENEM